MPRGNSLESRVLGRLSDLDAQGLRRTLRAPSGIDLSSNDYLNLSADPRIAARFIAGIQHQGCGSTGSRLLGGERPVFAQLESRFAAFKGTERALYFSSGYLANLAVLTGLTEPGDVILSDERNHASLIDGCRLSRAEVIVVPHNDVTALERLLDERAAHRAAAPQPGVAFVVVESLYSMDGDLAPLAEYLAICRSVGAVLVVDEAHAVGVYGKRGSGLIEQTGMDGNACISVNTAGKALGVAGAFAAGPAWAIEYLVQRARPFVFSTAPPPAIADALDASLDIVSSEPERRARLLARALYVRRRIAEAGIPLPGGSSQIVPIMVGDNARAVALAAAMQGHGFDVRAIRPPSVPPGTARLRVSINSELSEQTLDRFVDCLAGALHRIQPCVAASL
jgi:8-amino-7-oxononanoate synthase